MTEGKTGDVKAARTWTFPAGSVVVADRAYLDFKWFHQLQARGVTFVTRLKRGVRYRVTPNLVSNLNVFCMFSWRAPKVGDDAILIDLESQLGSIAACIAEFGTYTVVVKNTTEFLRRVELAAVRGGVLSHVRGPVRYINPDTFRTNPAEPLRIPLLKQERLAHQKEYRFVFQTGREPAGPLELPIGDIRDIAFCMRTEDIYDSVKVEETIDPSAS